MGAARAAVALVCLLATATAAAVEERASADAPPARSSIAAGALDVSDGGQEPQERTAPVTTAPGGPGPASPAPVTAKPSSRPLSIAQAAAQAAQQERQQELLRKRREEAQTRLQQMRRAKQGADAPARPPSAADAPTPQQAPPQPPQGQGQQGQGQQGQRADGAEQATPPAAAPRSEVEAEALALPDAAAGGNASGLAHQMRETLTKAAQQLKSCREARDTAEHSLESCKKEAAALQSGDARCLGELMRSRETIRDLRARLDRAEASASAEVAKGAARCESEEVCKDKMARAEGAILKRLEETTRVAVECREALAAHLKVRICVYIHTYTYMYVCVYMYIYIYITCINMYTYIHVQSKQHQGNRKNLIMTVISQIFCLRDSYLRDRCPSV